MLHAWDNIGDTLLKRMQTSPSRLATVDIFRIALYLPPYAKERTNCL